MRRSSVREKGKVATKTRKRVRHAATGANPFELPRSIHQSLRDCASAYAQRGASRAENVEYLWIDISEEKLSRRVAKERAAKLMGLEEWLNVIDEAAALGVHCMLVHAGCSLSAYPHVWTICKWAQETHGMMVGLHVHGQTLPDAEMDHFRQLDMKRACLFVDTEAYEVMARVRESGVPMCAADVTEDDCSQPCEMPECMVFVGPEGRLYSCGVVFGHRNYCLGSVLDKRLDRIVADAARPSVVTEHPAGNDCHGCPPIMAKRVGMARP